MSTTADLGRLWKVAYRVIYPKSILSLTLISGFHALSQEVGDLPLAGIPRTIWP
jgi:hypothetical protein